MKTQQRFLISVIAFAFYVIPSTVSAQWSFVEKVDDFTDEKITYALYSDNDHQIQISHEGKAVWIFITKNGLESFEPNGKIELRVDKNETRIIDPVKCKELSDLMGKDTFLWEPKTVGFLIWHGKEDEGCGYIGELLEGDFLNFRYQINSMESETYKISLEGAKEAIVQGLNLTICGK